MNGRRPIWQGRRSSRPSSGLPTPTPGGTGSASSSTAPAEKKAEVLDELRKLADTADLDRLRSPASSAFAMPSFKGDPERSIALLTAVYAVHPDDPQIVSDLCRSYIDRSVPSDTPTPFPTPSPLCP